MKSFAAFVLHLLTRSARAVDILDVVDALLALAHVDASDLFPGFQDSCHDLRFCYLGVTDFLLVLLHSVELERAVDDLMAVLVGTRDVDITAFDTTAASSAQMHRLIDFIFPALSEFPIRGSQVHLQLLACFPLSLVLVSRNLLVHWALGEGALHMVPAQQAPFPALSSDSNSLSPAFFLDPALRAVAPLHCDNFSL